MEQQGSETQQAQGNGMAVAAMVCGIVGVVFALIPCISWIGAVLGIIALALGYVAQRAPGASGMAMAGIVCGIVAIVLGAIFFIWFHIVVQRAGSDFQQGLQNFAEQVQQEAQRQQRQQQLPQPPAPKQFLKFGL